MVCSVGLSAAAACAALRAGIGQLGELPYVDRKGRPIIGAVVPGVDLKLRRGQRLVELLAMAVTDCLGDTAPLPLERVPVLVGLAEPGRPAGGARLADTIVVMLEERLGLRFHPRLSSAIPGGHTAGFAALRAARALLNDAEVAGCLICGVDSYINASSLLWLEAQWRLKHEDHSNGVIPGEAAAAVYVHRSPAPTSSVVIQLLGLGFGREQATITSEEPLLGLGLTGATRAALTEAGSKLDDMDYRLSDATGEVYGFKELALVVARLHRTWKAEVPHWHCADSIGDTGAAAGICQLVMASQAFRRNYAFGDRAICFTSAPHGDRAVAVLQRQREPAR
jgi:3-oxoacyl-[acyl-carrier-protein] synthase I